MLIYLGTPMVAAGLWKRQDIDRIEASLYRKVLGVSNMISNKAILNTMTSIRLAGEVVNYLSKEAWIQFRKQNRVTSFFDKKETEDAKRVPRDNNNRNQPAESEPVQRKEKLYIPRVMYNMMLATTSNSTSVHFGMDHMCKKHNRLFTLDHVESCDSLTGCQDIRKNANKLKD